MRRGSALSKKGTLVTPDFNIDLNFKIVNYTGNSTARSITTGISLVSRSMVFIFCRTTPKDVFIFNTADGATNFLRMNVQSAIFTDATSLTAFNADGFSLGTSSDINLSGEDYTAYCFSGKDSFFSLASYTSQGTSFSVAHDLAAVPDLLWVFDTESATFRSSWLLPLLHDNVMIWTSRNETSATFGTGYANTINPSSTTLTMGTHTGTDANINPYNAYLWRVMMFKNVTGVMKSGTFIGNGGNNVVDCGFGTGSQFVLIKSYNAIGHWYMYDSINGMTSNNNNYKVTNENWIENDNTGDSLTNISNSLISFPSGFAVYENATTNLNSDGIEYTYLAIANP